MLSRSALVEYQYSSDPQPIHHKIELNDCGAVCVVDGNIFSNKMALFGTSTKGKKDKKDFSWISVLEDAEDPIIVSYDPNALDKKPSMHAMGWCNKFMQTLRTSTIQNTQRKERCCNSRWTNIPNLRFQCRYSKVIRTLFKVG